MELTDKQFDVFLRMVMYEEPKPWTKFDWSVYLAVFAIILIMIGDVYV